MRIFIEVDDHTEVSFGLPIQLDVVFFLKCSDEEFGIFAIGVFD